MRQAKLGAMIAVASLTAQPASAHSAYLGLGDTIAPPAGFIAMCREGGPLCVGLDEATLPGVTAGVPMVTGAILPAGVPGIRGDCVVTANGDGYGTTTGWAARSTRTGARAAVRVTMALPLTGPAGAKAPGSCPDMASGLKPAERVDGVAPVAASLPAAPTPGPAARGASARTIQQLDQINRLVNHRVIQQTDQRIYGLPDLWTRSGIGRGATGDCEDIAIEKRYQLLKAGFEPGRLSFAVVYQSDVGLHTVLVARTERGDLVLDSRTDRLRVWNEVPYRWLSVQDFATPGLWHKATPL